MLAKSKPEKLALPPLSRHRSRYIRHRRENVPIEEIAKADGVSVAVVKKSILTMDAYYDLNTEEELKVATIELIRDLAPKEKKAIEQALEATRPIHDKETGDILRIEPDHEMRMAAYVANTKRIEALLAKKGFGTQVNLGVGVNVNQSGGVTQGGTFENRLREIQKNRNEFLLSPAEPEEVESEYGEEDEIVEGETLEAQPEVAEILDVGNRQKT